jgi:site-specific recombinase XerD
MNTKKNTPTKKSTTVKVSDSFGSYLKQVKQLSDETISKRLCYLEYLFTALNIDQDCDLSKQLTVESITSFVLDYGQNHGPGSFQGMATGIRSFLKYCQLKNILDRDFSALIPTVHRWQLANIPKAVSDEQIHQLLDSIDGSSAIDLRDKTIITLLAVYGVRGVHLRRLCLEDLDWEKSIIHFPSTKNGPPIDQSITVEVGNCLSEYLLKGRPQCAFKEVFLTGQGSVHPMTDSCMCSGIIRRRFKQAGIVLAEGVSHGTHGFRHAFATRLVGHIPFLDLSKMLGHSTPRSTFIYSKVAFSMLREATIPWPEEV